MGAALVADHEEGVRVTIEELDRLSILLADAHKCLEEAWRITIEAQDRHSTNDLVLADVKVCDVAERLGINVGSDVVERIEAYSRRA